MLVLCECRVTAICTRPMTECFQSTQISTGTIKNYTNYFEIKLVELLHGIKQTGYQRLIL